MGSESQQTVPIPPSLQGWQDPRGKQAQRKGRKSGPRELESQDTPQPPQLCSAPSTKRKPHRRENREQQNMTKPSKVTRVGPSPPSPTSTQRHRPFGTLARSHACQCLGGRSPCALSNRSSGTTSLELSLHPCAVLGGGVDGGTATGAGHLLPGLLVAGLGGLKVHSLSRRELPEGRGGW